jgi:hypothetical protein
MKSIKAVLLYAIVSFLFSFSIQKDSIIYWSDRVSLTWSNFEGTPLKSSKYSAISSVGIRVDYTCVISELYVYSYFTPSKSWVNLKDTSENILKHERGHFDIAEIFARKLRERILKSKFSEKKINIKISKMFNGIYEDYIKEQKLYDRETNLSKNNINQKMWDEKIKRNLEDLEFFSNPKLIINVH